MKIEITDGLSVEVSPQIVQQLVKDYVIGVTKTAEIKLPETRISPGSKSKWSETETETIQKEFNAKMKDVSCRRIGKLLGRSTGSVYQKARSLRIF